MPRNTGLFNYRDAARVGWRAVNRRPFRPPTAIDVRVP